MPHLDFTPNLQRLVGCPAGAWPGTTVKAVFDAAFSRHPQARAYVLDDVGSVRKHVQVFVNGEQIADRSRLSDPLDEDDSVFVMQALSGG